jgi:hypothetical protein
MCGLLRRCRLLSLLPGSLAHLPVHSRSSHRQQLLVTLLLHMAQKFSLWDVACKPLSAA